MCFPKKHKMHDEITKKLASKNVSNDVTDNNVVPSTSASLVPKAIYSCHETYQIYDLALPPSPPSQRK